MNAARSSTLAAAIGVAFIVVSAAASAQETGGPLRSSCAPGFANKIRTALDAYRQKSKAPGVAVAFFDNGEGCVIAGGVKGEKNPGPVTHDTLFVMGSIQKVFNSMLLAYDIEQGKTAIDDMAAKYLVAADGARVLPESAFSQITLRQLTTHTASLPDGAPPGQERVGISLYRDQPMPVPLMAYLNTWEPPYPPGTRYNYSNLGFVLVGHVATTLANRPHSEFLAEAITRPLGMTRTAREICDEPNPSCATGHRPDGKPVDRIPVGLWTTADDMLVFIKANLGVLNVPSLQARAIRRTHEELFRENEKHAVGMAWEERFGGNALLLAKNGESAGFTSWVAFQPNRHRGVAVLSNSIGKPPPATLGKELLALAEH